MKWRKVPLNSFCILSQIEINSTFLFSLDHERPAYFRIFLGSINSAALLRMKIIESNMVLVTDSGFFSSKNIREDEELDVPYIVPVNCKSRIDLVNSSVMFTSDLLYLSCLRSDSLSSRACCSLLP